MGGEKRGKEEIKGSKRGKSSSVAFEHLQEKELYTVHIFIYLVEYIYNFTDQVHEKSYQCC